MTRDKIEEYLVIADEHPVVKRKLERVVQEIDCNVPGSRIQNLMYDLIGILLMTNERVRELEYRVVGSRPGEELRRQSDTIGRQGKKGWQRVGILDSD